MHGWGERRGGERSEDGGKCGREGAAGVCRKKGRKQERKGETGCEREEGDECMYRVDTYSLLH